jgi:hypothetical protein
MEEQMTYGAMTYDEIRERLDLKHINAAAVFAADQLPFAGVAHVKLTPGDGTVYPIIVARCPVFNGDQRGREVMPRDYTVCVAASFGDTYQWGGQGGMQPDYVAEKWTRDGNKWTAVVVCEFLNRFSAARGTGVS